MSIGSAFSAFFGILFNKEKAALWTQASKGLLTAQDNLEQSREEAQKAISDKQQSDTKISELEKELKEIKDELAKPSKGDDAVYTLALLQREGRLIDFLQEDISAYEDAQIGAAVRQVHEGCRKVLDKHFHVEAILDSSEGESVSVEKGFDPSLYELSGNINGEAPYKGELRHKGWKAGKVELPTRQKAKNALVIHPSEVEVL